MGAAVIAGVPIVTVSVYVLDAVALYPDAAAWVAVIVVVPTARPVTEPVVALTVALLGSLLV
jgi:hypothetical protein